MTDWLPELILFQNSQGNWAVYLEQIHARFKADFLDSLPGWPGKRVGVKKHPEHAEKSATFWHLISEGSVEADRDIDLRRCERIGWPRPIMDEFDETPPDASASRIYWWKEVRRKEERYLLAPHDFSYLVVVADRGKYVLPWTAFWIEQGHRRKKNEKAFNRFWGAQ